MNVSVQFLKLPQELHQVGNVGKPNVSQTEIDLDAVEASRTIEWSNLKMTIVPSEVKPLKVSCHLEHIDFHGDC